MATGKVRFEFSGAGADFWYAHFLPDSKAFISPALFARATAVMPVTQGTPIPTIGGSTLEGHARPPEPLKKIPADAFQGLWVTPSPSGQLLAGAWSGGVVNVHALKGTAPKLQPLGGTAMPSKLTFTHSGRHLAAVQGGALHVYTLGSNP